MPSLRSPFFRRPTLTKFCVWGRIPDIFLGFKFHQDRLKMWELWRGRNFGLPIDLAHRLYNSLLLSHKPFCSIWTVSCIGFYTTAPWVQKLGRECCNCLIHNCKFSKKKLMVIQMLIYHLISPKTEDFQFQIWYFLPIKFQQEKNFRQAKITRVGLSPCSPATTPLVGKIFVKLFVSNLFAVCCKEAASSRSVVDRRSDAATSPIKLSPQPALSATSSDQPTPGAAHCSRRMIAPLYGRISSPCSASGAPVGIVPPIMHHVNTASAHDVTDVLADDNLAREEVSKSHAHGHAHAQ